MIAAGDDAEATARAFMAMREPACVLFFVNQHVVGLRRPEPVAVHLHRYLFLLQFKYFMLLASFRLHLVY